MAGGNNRPLIVWSKALVFIAFVNLLQVIGRLSFAILGLNGGIDQFLDVPVSLSTATFLHFMFFALGIAGGIALLGLFTKQSWAFSALILVSLMTIGFDIWGCTIQFTAAMGLVVPVLSLLYLLIQKEYLAQGLNNLQKGIGHGT